MPIPMIDPEQPFHLQKTPEEWEHINAQAMADHRRNPHDDEALRAIKDSNEALNAYDQPAIEAGKHVLPSGWGDPVEGLKGEAEGVGGAIAAPFHLANTLYRHGGAAGIDEIINGLTSIPGEVMSGDPRRIGNVAGNVAGGIAMGKLGGKIAKGAKGVISEYAERPALKNNLLKAQVTALQQGLAKSSAVMPDQIEQAGLRTETMKHNLHTSESLSPDKIEQSGLKTDLMNQSLEKGQQGITRGEGSLDATTKRPGLLNDLTKLQIEKLQKALEEGEDPDANGPAPEGAPLPPKPPTTGGTPTASDPKAEFMNSDPYGLNDAPSKPVTPPPPDILDNFIQSMKARTGDPTPVSDVDRMGNEAPPPMSPDALNELLNQLNKKPKGKGPNLDG